MVESNNQFPIDVVIPWVDDSDPVWLAERAKYMGEYHENKQYLDHYFRDWDTLRFVFRSIDKYMPWVRYIHFLTCGHLPSWLDTNNPKLKIHRHADFFSKDTVLPVFSARPIEMNLMNIPDLAEHFIYFNDDMIVVNHVTPDRFFTNSLPNDYLVFDIPRGGLLYDHIRIKDPYAQTCRNSIHLITNKIYVTKNLKSKKDFLFHKSYTKSDYLRNLIFTTFRYYEWIMINHNPQPYLLSHLKECLKLFPDAIKTARKHRFRENSDVNQYLYRDFALLTGQFNPQKFSDTVCIVLASIQRYNIDKHYLKEKNFVCLNDSQFLKKNEYPKLRTLVIQDLEEMFPTPSKFEK